MTLFSDFLFGKLPLWKAFVFFWLVAQLIATFAIGVAFELMGGTYFAFMMVMSISIPLAAFTFLGQWRCAMNTQYPALGWGMRIWLCIATVSALGELLPHLPPVVRSVIGLAFIVAVLFAVGYAIYAPVRMYLKTRKP